MGRKGPVPKPAKVLKLSGSRRVTKDRAAKEPPSNNNTPRMPGDLDNNGKAAWKFITRKLKSMGVLDSVDGLAIDRYCRVYSRWRKAEDFLAQHGSFYPVKDENGQIKRMATFPQAYQANTLVSLLTKAEQELCMTPAARARIGRFADTGDRTVSLGDRFYKCG